MGGGEDPGACACERELSALIFDKKEKRVMTAECHRHEDRIACKIIGEKGEGNPIAVANNNLNTRTASINAGVTMAGKLETAGRISFKDVGVVYGFAHLGKIIDRGAIEIDKSQNALTAPVEKRPSTYVYILGSILAPVLGMKLLKGPWDIGAVVTGAVMSTKLQDLVEELATGTRPAFTQSFRPALPMPLRTASSQTQVLGASPIQTAVSDIPISAPTIF